MSNLQSGATYYELKDDGVYVHTAKTLNGKTIGDSVYKVTYRNFNRMLQQEAGEVESSAGWGILDSFMRKRGGAVEYILPQGTYEVSEFRGVLYVRQKIGSKHFPFFQSGMASEQKYKGDYGSEYVVEWKVTGNLHDTYREGVIQVHKVQKIVSGSVLNGTAVFRDVPFLKNKLERDFGTVLTAGTKTIMERRKHWMAGAEPILRYIQGEDLQDTRFVAAFERSSAAKVEINWEGV